MNALIAVPAEQDSGLDATRSMHFGHAPDFALVEVTDGQTGTVRVLTNPPHSQGGCMTTVNLLAAQGVTAVSAGGMGRGPLSGLMAAGIPVHHDPDSTTVRDAIAAVIDGRTSTFGSQHACQGH